MIYNPKDWYWIVAGSATHVYSSANGDYVPVSDETYQAWLAAGGAPTRIASEDELAEVLAPYQIRPAAATVLDKYKDAHARRLTVEIVAKVQFNHENRIRALEGRQAVTPQQFRNVLKELM
jgi:hypothetical protein